MSRSQRQLMESWDKMYPVSAWECKREKHIADIQRNINIFVQRGCE